MEPSRFQPLLGSNSHKSGAFRHASRLGIQPKDTKPERRAGTRFPLTLELRYAALGGQAPAETVSGRTIDLSSSGLSFTADRPLSTGRKFEISIDWPVLLDGCVQLQLVMRGQVVRTDGFATGLQIERHEFRTRRGGVSE